MSSPRAIRPLFALLLLAAAGAAQAWSGAVYHGPPRTWFGFSITTPAIHHHGYHYRPGWGSFAPAPHAYGNFGYYAPRPPRHWRHFDRHDHRRWAHRHHHQHRDHRWRRGWRR
ncbi:MAG: hypothetical protein RLW61_22075 [Gammaproteobacteria bacterium]